jgi:antitoxin ParD1/3/4
MSERASMNISLPESMREWVEERIKAEGYGTASEYFRQLVRQEQKRRARQEMEEHLLRSLDSGPSRPFTPEDWAAIRREVRERVAKAARKKAG